MTKKTVLVIGSNSTRIELRSGGSAQIGQYLNEMVVPVSALIEAGYAIVFATPDGTKPSIDEASITAKHFGGDEAALAGAKSFYAEHPSMNEVRSLASIIAGGLDDYAGLFIPGGHAPAVDLMQDVEMGVILRYFHETKKPTALLCHAPVAIIAATLNAKEFREALIAGDKTRAAELTKGWVYEGYTVTVFSSSEEVAAEEILNGKLYFDMPEALKLAGAKVVTNPVDSTPNLAVDRELITGQNPNSDHLIAAELIGALVEPPAIA